MNTNPTSPKNDFKSYGDSDTTLKITRFLTDNYSVSSQSKDNASVGLIVKWGQSALDPYGFILFSVSDDALLTNSANWTRSHPI